jgi:DNA-binding transcriptional LysR family regulator
MALAWDDVRLFLALMREGTLTRAAKVSGVDISTVSRRLAALEASVGATLFIRSREGVRPTAAAESMAPDAELAFEAMGRIERVTAGFETAPEGVVRLTVLPSLAESLILPLLPKLAARYPRLRLELSSSPFLMDLSRREADVAIRNVRPRSGDLVFVKLFDAPYAFYASRALARRLGRLKTLPLVGWTPDLSGSPASRWLSQHAADADVILRTNTLESQLVAAQLGVGLALVPVQLGERTRGLVRFELARFRGIETPREELWLVGHQALRHVPRVRAVWEFLREQTTRLLTGP